MSGGNKKILILKIFEQLKSSNIEEPITQAKILQKLNNLGYNCDRKTVYLNIKYLQNMGYVIEKIPGGGCYYVGNLHDDLLSIVKPYNSTMHYVTLKFYNVKLMDKMLGDFKTNPNIDYSLINGTIGFFCYYTSGEVLKKYSKFFKVLNNESEEYNI